MPPPRPVDGQLPRRTRREFQDSTGDAGCGRSHPPQCLSPTTQLPLHHWNTPAPGGSSCTCLQATHPWVDPICHLCTLSRTSSKMQAPFHVDVLKGFLPKPSQDAWPSHLLVEGRTLHALPIRRLRSPLLPATWETGTDSRKPS